MQLYGTIPVKDSCIYVLDIHGVCYGTIPESITVDSEYGTPF